MPDRILQIRNHVGGQLGPTLGNEMGKVQNLLDNGPLKVVTNHQTSNFCIVGLCMGQI